MAKKKVEELDTEPAEVFDTEPAPREVHDPAVHVCLDGNYVEHEGAATKERRLRVDGTNYEHVGEDEDGCWTYRAMPG